MEDKEPVIVPPEASEVVDAAEYSEDPQRHFKRASELAKPILKTAKAALAGIEKKLYASPAFVTALKAALADPTLIAVLTDEQKRLLRKDALRLMTKKDGTLLAKLIDPKSKKISRSVPLKSIKMTPELTRAITDFSAQMQLAQLAEQIQAVQYAVEQVLVGQQHDRLATAYSCREKLLQVMAIEDPALRRAALLQVALSAEDSRNLLMESQKSTVRFLKKQPEEFIPKLLSGASSKDINARLSELRESLCAVNMVSLAAAMAYRELGEEAAAQRSLAYYAEFLEKTYLGADGILERMDMIDPLPDNYWSRTLPEIAATARALPCAKEPAPKKTKKCGRTKK